MTLDMQLTDEEIKEIADRMGDLMWEGFHDIVDVLGVFGLFVGRPPVR